MMNQPLLVQHICLLHISSVGSSYGNWYGISVIRYMLLVQRRRWFPDPGSDLGSDPGTDPGSDPGSDPGTDPGSDRRLYYCNQIDSVLCLSVLPDQ